MVRLYVLRSCQGYSRSSTLVPTEKPIGLCDFLLVSHCNYLKIILSFIGPNEKDLLVQKIRFWPFLPTIVLFEVLALGVPLALRV